MPRRRPTAARSAARPAVRGMRPPRSCAARPVAVRGRAGGAASSLQPYRGYGSRERIFVIGRAFWQRTDAARAREASSATSCGGSAAARCAGARIRARFYGAETLVETDRDGYFRVEMAPGGPVPRDRLWHRLDLAMLAPRDASPPRPTSTSRRPRRGSSSSPTSTTR